MSASWNTGERGQSLVEVVAMAPIVLICGMFGLQALAAGTTYVFADNAAHAGALAAELDRSPTAAARAALPGWATGRVAVKREGNRVVVSLRPRSLVPKLSGLLATHAEASFLTGGELDAR